MQVNSKPWQKSHNQTGACEPEKRARKAVSQALQKSPQDSTAQLISGLKSSGEDYIPALAEVLVTQFFEHEIRSLRHQQAASQQLRLPGFEHLPTKIPGRKNQLVAIGKATYTRIRSYYRALSKSLDARKRNNPRLLELKRLMDLMEKRRRRDPKITVQEVLVIEA